MLREGSFCWWVLEKHQMERAYKVVGVYPRDKTRYVIEQDGFRFSAYPWELVPLWVETEVWDV